MADKRGDELNSIVSLVGTDLFLIIRGTEVFNSTPAEVSTLVGGLTAEQQATLSFFEYDSMTDTLIATKTITVPAASLEIGTNLALSDFGEILAVMNNALNISQLLTGGDQIEEEGVLLPDICFSPPSEQLAEQLVDTDTSSAITEASPAEFVLDPSVFTSSIPTDEFLVLQNTNDFATIPPSGQIRNQIWIGTDDTGHMLFDGIFDVSVGLTTLKPPNPQVFRSGELYFSRTAPVGTGSFTFKGVQVGPDFIARSDIRGYPLQRSRVVTRNTADSLKAPYQNLNDEYDTVVAKTGGIVHNYLPTATADTTTTGTFTPGDAGVSNPTLDTDGAATFAQDDIVLISNTNFNSGFFEVESHAANLLTVKGVGTVATTEDFTRDNFLNSTGGIHTDFGATIGEVKITKVNVSVIRANASGDWETGKGSVTPISFSAIGSGAGVETGGFDANDAIFPSSNPAAADSRNSHPILAYDDTTAESVIFSSSFRGGYLGGDVIVDIDWVAATATSGGVTWGVEFERNAPGGTDIDADSFDTQQTEASTTNGTSGIITRTTTTLTQAEADDIEALDAFRVRIQRVVGDGGDTMTGDAQVLKVRVR